MAEQEQKQLARLCDLITASLHPFLEPKPPPQLTRESEKRLLLALSRVNKVIRGWGKEEKLSCGLDQVNEMIRGCNEEELGCGLDQEFVADSNNFHNCCVQSDQAFDDRCRCLVNIISIMIGFLGFCSDYVKHSAENILFAISSSLIKFETIWIQFVELVWATIHAATSTSAQCALSSVIESDSFFADSSICGGFIMENQDHDIHISSSNITSFIALLKLRCTAMSGQMLASLFRVLHAILKSLKHNDSELKGNYICLSILHLYKMPWDSYCQLNGGEPISSVRDNKFGLNNDSAWLGILSGTTLQLLCSLVKQNDLEDIDEWDMYSKLANIVPKLLSFLNAQQGGPEGLSQYLKHKILMLMMRLKPHMQQRCSHLVLWLKLLRQYFQDLLHKPMLQHFVDSQNCLEGSPFLSRIPDLVKIHNKSTRHLHRQATYLFLSCCFSLVNIKNDTGLQCSCKRDAPLFAHELQAGNDHCSCICLLEISEWFQSCCCLEKIVDSKSPTDFALSFLKLYMEEDDMLFSMLLQLLDAPLVALKIDSIETKSTSKLMGARLFSSIFDPVHLFHLLLLLLHYDHLVLVDYLISKDTGVHCAQYLLRCLRLVSQSWHAFVDDSMYEGKVNKLSCKRQKISKDVNDIRGNLGPSLFIDGSKIGSSCGRTRENNLQLFGNAKECLLSLKKTVEDLHRKDLFPYNPKPLLRRLTRFEELCQQG